MTCGVTLTFCIHSPVPTFFQMLPGSVLQSSACAAQKVPGVLGSSWTTLVPPASDTVQVLPPFVET